GRTAGVQSWDGLNARGWYTHIVWRLCCSSAQEGVIDGLRPPTFAALDLLQRGFIRHRGPIGTRGRERIVHVHDAYDLRRHRDLLAAHAIGIAGAIVALVVPAHDRLQVPRALH